MPVARAYFPATVDDLRALAATRELAPCRGVAVAPGAAEDVEHLAWVAAAELAAELTHGSPDPSAGPVGRRVVISADTDIALLSPEPGNAPTAVALSAPVPLRRLVSLHVDEAPGSGLADLLWYDITELDDVLAVLSAG